MNSFKPEQPLYWDDIDREEDPDWDNKIAERLRKEKLENHGCVARAVSSVAGVPLTREQENLRLAQRDNNPIDTIDILWNLKEKGLPIEPADAQRVFYDTVAGEQQRVLEFVTQVQAQKDTPAGQALSEYTIGYQALTPEGIRQVYAEGGQVILAEIHHAAHIVPNVATNTFISLSDGGIPFALPDSPMDVIVLAKK